MVKRCNLAVVASVASLLGSTVLAIHPAKAQSCAALPIVDGKGTQVQKAVSPPSTGVTRDNWSTDFTVPSTQSFRRYVARIVPENGGEYRILVALKYNNNTSSTVFDRTIQLPEQRPYNIQARAGGNSVPYQLNVEVGGIRAIGNTYTVSAFGCN